jgi:cytochrome b561
MTATVLLSTGAGHSHTMRNWHMAAGITTAALYFTAASFAWAAPKPEGVVDKGSSKIHRILAWIHVPLMVITPVLGGLARERKDSGQKVTFPVSLHGAAGVALLATYAASAAVMAFDF